MENGTDLSEPPSEPTVRPRGIDATLEDKVNGIAATVGRIDVDVERMRDLQQEDHALLAQIATDVAEYKSRLEKVTDLILERIAKIPAA